MTHFTAYAWLGSIPAQPFSEPGSPGARPPAGHGRGDYDTPFDAAVAALASKGLRPSRSAMPLKVCVLVQLTSQLAGAQIDPGSWVFEFNINQQLFGTRGQNAN